MSKSYIPGKNSLWSWCIILFLHIWILHAKTVRVLYLYLWETLVCSLTFMLHFSDFVIRAIWASWNEWGNVLSSVFWKRLYRNRVNSLKFWGNSQWSCLRMEIGGGDFKIMNSFLNSCGTIRMIYFTLDELW